MTDIYTVRDLTDKLRRSMEGLFPFVWVKGEVSNVSRPGSGHVYFSLKDADALLNCVWFRGQQRGAEHFDPLTGEVFEDGPRPSLAHGMTNGQQIMCAGRITVYAPRGSYQLVVELAQDAGQGQLHAAFEALKLKLAERGFFARERKRSLHANPCRVAIITAPTGAVIHDFLRVASTRGSGAELRLYPVPVQGATAAPAIVQALRHVNEEGWAQVVALLRGGGSLEDLWAFNEETVAEAVFQSGIPVIAGIGHEVDVSMADMTADVRAATPSHAAQLLWPDREEMIQQVDAWETALQEAMQRFLSQRRQELEQREQALNWLSPERSLRRSEERFINHFQRLQLAGERILSQRDVLVRALDERLRRCAEAPLERRNLRLAQQGEALRNSLELHLRKFEAMLEQWDIRLHAASPLLPLERGYALVRDAQGQVLRSVDAASRDAHVEILLRDGRLDAAITDIHKDTTA